MQSEQEQMMEARATCKNTPPTLKLDSSESLTRPWAHASKRSTLAAFRWRCVQPTARTQSETCTERFSTRAWRDKACKSWVSISGGCGLQGMRAAACRTLLCIYASIVPTPATMAIGFLGGGPCTAGTPPPWRSACSTPRRTHARTPRRCEPRSRRAAAPPSGLSTCSGRCPSQRQPTSSTPRISAGGSRAGSQSRRGLRPA